MAKLTPNQLNVLAELHVLRDDPHQIEQLPKHRRRVTRRLIDLGLVDCATYQLTDAGIQTLQEASTPIPWTINALSYRAPQRQGYGFARPPVVAQSNDRRTTYVGHPTVKGVIDAVAIETRTIPAEILDSHGLDPILRVVPDSTPTRSN